MAIAKLDSVYVENVTAEELEPVLLMDEARTASGKLKRDILAVKRRWKLSAKYLTEAQGDAILNLLSAKSYGAVAFWLDRFGAESNTVLAYVTVDRAERVQFADSTGVWESRGYNLELTVEEV